MPELNATIAADFTRFYREKAAAIFALLAPLSDKQLWTRPFPYGNSIGHLLLHLTGNLNYYIGAEIAATKPATRSCSRSRRPDRNPAGPR